MSSPGSEFGLDLCFKYFGSIRIGGPGIIQIRYIRIPAGETGNVLTVASVFTAPPRQPPASLTRHPDPERCFVVFSILVQHSSLFQK